MDLFYRGKMFLFMKLIPFLSASSGSGDDEQATDGILEKFVEALTQALNSYLEQLDMYIENSILGFFQKIFREIFNWIMSLALTLSADIFSNDLVVSWFGMIATLAKLCFFAGLVIYVANIGIKLSVGRRLFLQNDFKTVIVYLGFAWFGVEGATVLMTSVNTFLASNQIIETPVSLWSASMVLTDLVMGGDGNGSSIIVVEIIVLFLLIIGVFSFIGSIMKRIAYLFILITALPLYLFGFSSGRSSTIFSWFKLYVAAMLTFLLQYTFFYMACHLIIGNAFILSYVFFILIPLVPLGLAQFGAGTGSMGDLLEEVKGTVQDSVEAGGKAATAAI